MSQDILHINSLEVRACIGVYTWEKQIQQSLILDLELRLPAGIVSDVARRDQLERALDYTQVAACAARVASESSCQLLETFAEKLSATLLEQFPLHSVRLSVHKPAALPPPARVCLVIERFR